MQFSLLLNQGKPVMENSMFRDSEIPSKLGLLLVDDEEFNLKALKRTLRGQGFNIFCASNGDVALEIMDREDIAIVVSDMRMPSMSGDQLLIRIGEKWPETLKIILTGYTDISNTLNVLNSSSIFRYLSKPWDDDFLLSTIHEASAVYWGKVMDFYFEQSTKEQNEKLHDSNHRLRESVEQSHYQLKKINDKLKKAYDGEKRLRRERQTAERENIAKSQFLATMSHEIRTPLNSIIATSSLLLESDLTDEQKDLVNLSLNGGTTLLSQINDILDFSKINAGKLDLHEEWFNIVSLVEETCELLSGQIINKPVDIISIIQPETPLEVYGDKTRVRQIITNLLSNALKFTEAGCVSLNLSYNSELCISIKDSGIGMSDDDVKHIFDEFTQVDGGSTRARGGSGLGLSICRQLSQLMQGRIKVESKVNIGSTFTVNLPLASRMPIGFPVFSGLGRNIILISTNIHLHAALQCQLEFFNCTIKLCEYLPDDSQLSYDAILFDFDSICIPPEFFEKIKNIHNPQTIEIALISNDGIGRSKHTKDLGFDAVLRKPFRTSSILRHLIYKFRPLPKSSDLATQQKDIINSWISLNNEPVRQSDSYSLNATILLAEDSPSNQAVIKSVLKNMEVSVDIANNGREAVNLSDKNLYDIILMDMAMPVMDGISASKHIIESNSINSKTPIIALTANAYAEDKKRCLQSGMVDFLQKPIDINTFRSKLHEWCSKESPTIQNNNSLTHNILPSIHTKKITNHENMIDKKIYLQLEQDTSKDVLPSIIEIFLEETKNRLKVMTKLFSSEDWEALSREAHTLKSSSGSFGAIPLSKLARDIELSIENNNPIEIQKHQIELNTTIEATGDALKAIINNGFHDTQ